jgi:hypothetical protein
MRATLVEDRSRLLVFLLVSSVGIGQRGLLRRPSEMDRGPSNDAPRAESRICG